MERVGIRRMPSEEERVTADLWISTGQDISSLPIVLHVDAIPRTGSMQTSTAFIISLPFPVQVLSNSYPYHLRTCGVDTVLQRKVEMAEDKKSSIGLRMW